MTDNEVLFRIGEALIWISGFLFGLYIRTIIKIIAKGIDQFENDN